MGRSRHRCRPALALAPMPGHPRFIGFLGAAGFSECLVLAVARKAGHLPLGTFDGNLAKLDGAQRLSH